MHSAKKFMLGLIIMAGTVLPTSAASAQSPPQRECAVTSVIPIDASGQATATANEVDGVLVDVVGPTPADLSETLDGVIAEATNTTSPLVVEVIDTVEGVEVEVTGVTGPLPASLSGSIADALGCSDRSSYRSPSEDSSAAESEQSAMECQVTSVLPVDAEGEATAAADEVEGVVIGVTGPLPADVSDTIGTVFAELDGQTGPVAVTIVETVGGVEAEVTGVTGPLPVGLSDELATALNCEDTTPPAEEPSAEDEPTESDDPSDDSDTGDTPSEGSDGGASAPDDGTEEGATSNGDTDTAVLSGAATQQEQAGSEGELPRTGGGGVLAWLGTLLAGAGYGLRRWGLPG